MKKRYFIISILIFSIFLVPLLVKAQITPGGSGNGSLSNPLTATSFIEVFYAIIKWLTSIVGLVAVLMIIIAGVQYMFAGGNEDRVKGAQRTLFWSVIGLIIALASWSLLKVILGILGKK